MKIGNPQNSKIQNQIVEDLLIQKDSKNKLHLTLNWIGWINNVRISDIEDRVKFFEQSKTLNLDKCRIKIFPMQMNEFGECERLHLKQNEIKEFPESILKLNKLRKLDLQNNQLSSLPEGFSSLKSLDELWLENN